MSLIAQNLFLRENLQDKTKARKSKNIIQIGTKIYVFEDGKMIANISKTKSCFFENIIKIDQLLARLTENKRQYANDLQQMKWGKDINS